MGAPELLLDPEIKVWVLFPILAVMILVGIARHFSILIVQPTPPQANLKELREQAYLEYGSNLCNNAFNLTPEGYSKRAVPLVAEFRAGTFLANPNQPPPSAVPSFTDPQSSQALIGGIRNQVLNYVPQTLTMQWISAFFGEFLVMKLPFPLTTKFKAMLQANVNTYDLDVRWVSSISLYVLLLVGLGGVFHLILGGGNEASQSTGSAAGSGSPLAANIDKKKLFESEADALEIERQTFVLTGVKDRVLQLPI